MSLTYEMKGFANFCMPLMVNFYNKHLAKEVSREKVEIISMPYRFFSPIMKIKFFEPNIYVREDYLFEKEFRKEHKRFLIHELCHIIHHQLFDYNVFDFFPSINRLSNNNRILFIDEGVAEFFSLYTFSYLYGNATIERIADRLWYNIEKTNFKLISRYFFNEDDWVILNIYTYGSNFFRNISNKHGIKEVFNILENPKLVNLENILEPKKYKPQ